MLFDDHKKNLEITITPMDRNKKILTIKKAKYMNSDYENFIVSGLSEINIARHLFIAQDVRLRKGDQVNDAIGIIMQGLRTNEDVVKYLIDQLDSDFCHINGIKTELHIEATKEQLDLIAAIEDMVLPELKEIQDKPFKLKKCEQSPPFPPHTPPPSTLYPTPLYQHKGMDDEYDSDEFYDEEDFIAELFSSIGDISISGGGYIPCAGIIKGEDFLSELKDAPWYLRNFPICPNISLTILSGIYKDFYAEYVRNSLIHKVFKLNSHEEEEKFANGQKGLQQLLKSMHKELALNSKYIRNCFNCPYIDQCS